MDRSVRAALLSALVFPGAGHLLLKRAARGCIFLLPALVAAIYFVGQLMQRASFIIDQVLAGTMPLDPALIAARLEHQGGRTPLMTFSIIVIIVCWAGSIIDSFLIGRARAR
jgi:TM2 domain-containing membrane protein YozV